MRQGNGADILGANDPRGVTIGMIYVAPNDDWEGVLSAIKTQENLGRKQIAIVLPEKNRALQQHTDFDHLKDVNHKIGAQLVLIAPSGSVPADFARHRNFPVYSTLDTYKASLQDGASAAQAPKSGWRSVKKPKFTAAKTPPVEAKTPAKAPVPVILPVPVPDGTVAANVPAAADSPKVQPVADGQTMGTATPQAAPSDTTPASVPTNEGELDDSTDPKSHSSVNDQQAPVQSQGVAAPLAMPIENIPTPKVSDQAAQQANAAQAASSSSSSAAKQSKVPGIIPLISQGKRKTGPMPARTGPQKQGSAALTVGAVGNPPPPRRANAVASPAPGHRAHQRQWWLVGLIVLLVCSLLFCGTLVFAAPNAFGGIGGMLKGGNLPQFLKSGPSATVTLVPKTIPLSNTYEISAVTTTPQSAQRQVKARQLTSSTSTQNKTVNATGIKQTPATQATGQLTFYNALGTSQTVSSGTVFNVGNGIQIENTQAASIPAARPPTEGSVTVSAKAVTTGSRGNIPANTLYLASCCATGITVSNPSAFSGGQDPQNYTVVSQGDVNNAATPLLNQLLPMAQASLKNQVQSGETFAAQPKCSKSVTSNPVVGAAAKTVTVSVSASCSGEVYDQNGAEALTASLLEAEAQGKQYAGYVLIGNISTSQPQVLSINSANGSVLLLVKAQGTWVYQFSAAQKTALAKDIAGKTKTQAQSILLQQAGVFAVQSIDIPGGNTLPTDPTQIAITIASISATPTAGPGSPTSSPSPPVTPVSGTPTAPGNTPSTGNG
jgi:hypothetical protein